MEQISLKKFNNEQKGILLKELGFSTDGTWIYDMEGNKVLDRYIDEPVQLSNCLIFPGSVIILDNNPLSIAEYLEEFGDVLG